MSIKGIGVDIEKVGRFRKLPYKSNLSFYRNIFTPAEIKYCLSKADPHPHFAARFAAKEAIIKACGLKLSDVRSVEILNDKTGRPHVKIKKCDVRVLISLSHTHDCAIAVALVANDHD